MVLLLYLKLYTIFIRLISLSDIYLTILDGHFELIPLASTGLADMRASRLQRALEKKTFYYFKYILKVINNPSVVMDPEKKKLGKAAR